MKWKILPDLEMFGSQAKQNPLGTFCRAQVFWISWLCRGLPGCFFAMGCGGSVSKQNLSEELEAHQLELENERRRLQEKDSQLASVQECLQKQLRGSEQDGIGASNWCPQILSFEMF